MTTGVDHRSNRARGLWQWPAAGLAGPAILWAALQCLPDRKLPLGEVVAFLYPTWLFGWLVMGTKSRVVGNAILLMTVVCNVAVFTAVGFVFRHLRRRGPVTQWGTTVLVYAAAYAVITLFAYQLM